MMSAAFYQYLQQMPVGGSFTMTINACQTSVNYDEMCIRDRITHA